MANFKLNDSQWEEARVDYEVHGHSMAKIGKKFNIGRSTVKDRVHKYDWVKNRAGSVIKEKIANAKEALQQATPQTAPETAHYLEECENLAMDGLAAEFIDVMGKSYITKKAVKKGHNLLLACETGQEYKAVIEGLDKLSLLLGVNPRFASSQVINNTNAQQNNAEIRIVEV